MQPVHEPGNLELILTVTIGALAGSVYRDYVNSLGLLGNERALDFGSGSGNPARYLAPILQEGGHLTCLDVSEKWLNLCRRRLSSYPHVDCLLGDIGELGLPDAAYEVVFLHFVLHDIPASDRPRITAHLARVLKPAGKLFVREPLMFITEQEVHVLLTQQGLERASQKTTHIKSQGDVLEAVDIKP